MRPPAPPRQPRRTPAPPAQEPETPETRTGRPVRSPGGEVAPRTGARLVLPRRRPAEDAPRPSLGTVSTGLAARLAERAAADRRLLLRRLAIAVTVLAVLGGLAWLVLLSPVLALRAGEIEIVGAEPPADAAQVRAAVADEVGTPLLRIDTAAAAAEVAGITTVRDAEVTRVWPHGLRVAVTPRTPVASAAGDGGWALLDEDGVQVAQVPEPPEDLPRVTVPLDDTERTAPALAAALTVLGVLPADLLGQVAEAGASGSELVTLTLDDGAVVKWGTAEESELKAAVLEVLRQQPAAVYDVSVPRSPTTR